MICPGLLKWRIVFAVAIDKISQVNESVLSIRLLFLLERMPASKQDVHLLRTAIRHLEVRLANPLGASVVAARESQSSNETQKLIRKAG